MLYIKIEYKYNIINPVIYVFCTKSTLIQVSKQYVSPNGEPISFPIRLGMAAFAGGCGGIIGTPGDMINVRMQNDIKLPLSRRRK